MSSPKAGTAQSTPLTRSGYSILGLSDAPSIQAESRGGGPRAYAATSQDVAPVKWNEPVPERAISRDLGSPPVDPQQNDLLNRNLDYLFEDDESKHSTRWRLYAGLVLLVVAAGVIWQWQRNGYPWDNLTPATGQNIAPVPASPAPAASSPAGSQGTAQAPPAPDLHPEAGPDPAVSQSSKPESKPEPKPEPEKAGEAETSPSPTETAARATSKAPELQAAAQTQNGGASVVPTESNQAEAPNHGAAEPAQNKPLPVAPAESDADSAPTVPREATNSTDALQLLQEATKYLFGSGVEQDCTRANQDLRQAARFNSDAESMLGTMYASGHCVGRDLPAAYRWYARALRGKPDSARLQKDLTVLWDEMTPDEKRAATHGTP